MPSIYTHTFMDRSKEKATTSLYLKPITAGNFATILDQITTATPDGLALAVSALSLCTTTKTQVSLDPNTYAEATPASPYAQRELVLVVQYQDNVTQKKYSFSIPGVNWQLLELAAESDLVNEAALVWIAFKTAVEAYCCSPDGNNITILGGRLAGRNR